MDFEKFNIHSSKFELLSPQCIYITNSGTTLCAQCLERKLKLTCCVAIFYFCTPLYQNFSVCLFIAKFSLAIKYTKKSL